MLFNSTEFALFFSLVFFIYWFIANKTLNTQNLLLIVASYIYYAWWDWRFLSLLLINSSMSYAIGIALSNQDNPVKRKLLLLTNIIISIGLLSFFKYYNFFVDSFVTAFSFFEYKLNARTLNILLPIGISFYTFQILSYTIDVYRRNFTPTRDIVAFFAFASFFPLLLAGPIERAGNLLLQLYTKRKFDYDKAVDGMRQILWGLFKKMVIADNCAFYVNNIFTHYGDYSGSTLLLGAILFAVQIYGDFSGYSDIAIGSARLLGINLMKNFAFPYFSRDIAEFWRRWHISLTRWFRDYLYIPLGGSRGTTWMTIRNTFIIFLICGFWHGAKWTFLAWGLVNAIYFLPLLLLKRNRKHLNIVAQGRKLPSFKELLQIASTFFITVLAWVFFRAESMKHAILYLSGLFSESLFSTPQIFPKKLIMGILMFAFVEWVQREKEHALQIENIKVPRPVRWGIYYSLVLLIIWSGGIQQEFIYFQF